MKNLSTLSPVPFSVKDFAYTSSNPLYFGINPTNSPVSPVTPERENPFPCKARALYDFEAEDSSELSFKEGDLIDVFETKATGWLLGTLGKKKGLIPETYVCIEDGKYKSASKSSPESSTMQKIKKLTSKIN
ncbi:Rho GTPase activating protein 10 [Coelomomyces lativittatus]|nr:Rho GTPase activating protein 10 [Coelomomyces lativittatus]KAJ1513459.1 Rho GTPase activating protein 10 [Coelomomyces lativittatus]KAJ1514110.1 Rho GTPase activating protein 10 [Coelomomyces lativittatus]